jgi:tryptophan-rich sensory protein
MPLDTNNGNQRSIDGIVLLFLFGLFLFLSPFTYWWAAVASVWYLPYLFWLGFAGLIAWVTHRRRHDV